MTEATPRLTYAIVTPARNEAGNLDRLAKCLIAQSQGPTAWTIVDTGSQDGTLEIVRKLAAEHAWISVLPFPQAFERGGPIVRAFHAGVEALPEPADVIVKLDADVSVESGFFEALLRRFVADATLGIASGICLEEQNGEWVPRHVTGDHVWGACRAYRAACLAEVSPLEERMGWDGIDAFKAKARGWHTATFADLPFRHHRPEGIRDGKWRSWSARGQAAHYMGYRPTFLVFRTVHRIREDPVAIAMIYGWAQAAVRREARFPDEEALAVLRRQQRLRELPRRSLEALGRRSGHA